MLRRTSDYFRGRASTVVVNETRGAPYKFIAIFNALIALANGIRFIFFCDQLLWPEGQGMRDTLDGMFPDCRTDKWQEFSAACTGCLCLMYSLLRVRVALAEHVADLYNNMFILVCVNIIFVFIMLRLGVDTTGMPREYLVFIISYCLYEGYVFLCSRRAHLARLKSKNPSAMKKAD